MYEAGKAAQVSAEMRRYNIAPLGLSETRWLQAGQKRLASGELLLYSGHEEENAAHIVTKKCMTKTLANQSKTNTLFVFSTYKKKNKLVLRAMLAVHF